MCARVCVHLRAFLCISVALQMLCLLEEESAVQFLSEIKGVLSIYAFYQALHVLVIYIIHKQQNYWDYVISSNNKRLTDHLQVKGLQTPSGTNSVTK